MLTAELAIVAYEGPNDALRAVPDRLTRARHGHYLSLATRMLEIYREGIGQSRRSLHRRVEALFADEQDCPPRRIHAFCKLLDDASEFATDPHGASAKLRLRVFEQAARLHPLVTEKLLVFDHPVGEARAQIAAELGMSWAQIEQTLYRDVLDEQPLRRFEGYASAASLLNRYNLAQAQAALYRARALTVEAHADFKTIVTHVKLAGLLHEIEGLPGGGYRLRLTGPASILHETRRYGAAMARFLPGLVACHGWLLRAELTTPHGGLATLELSERSGLRSDTPAPSRFDSGIEEAFARKLGEGRAGWSCERESRLLHDGQSVFVPDFLMKHEDGTEIHLEIVGFWTPEYLAKKRETIRRFRQHRLLLVVPEHNVREPGPREAEPGEVERGEAEPGEHEPGERDPGEREPGEQEAGEPELSETEPGERGSGDRLPIDVVTYKSAISVEAVLASLEKMRRRARTVPLGEAQAPAVELRDYQRECLRAIRAAYLEGVRRQLVCLPTGTGKTVVFAELPRFLRMSLRMLVLAHRSELLEQARDKLRRAAPSLRVELEQGEHRASEECDVVVASVPTVGREGSARLRRLRASDFSVIVVDEAHHATASSYRRVLEHFGAFEPGTPKLVVGFTATPKRGDGRGLGEIFEQIVFSRTLPDMIDAGYLAKLAGYRVQTDVDLSRVKVRHGDYAVGELAHEVNTDARNALLVDVYRKHIDGRKTVCFCVDVAHAEAVAAAFAQDGVEAAAVTGEMDEHERREVLEAFRTGALRVVTNCMVLTEGYDEPSIEAVMLARPTRSGLLYTQMIGRGTRLCQGKNEVAIVDVVDVTREHRLATLPSLFGLSDSFDLEGHTVTETRALLDWVAAHRPWIDPDQSRSVSELRYRCERIDLLALELPSELRGGAKLAWTRSQRGRYSLALGTGEAIVVSGTIVDRWEVVQRSRGVEKVIHTAPTLAAAVRWAESAVERLHPEMLGLLLRETRWRREPATARQLELLRAKGLEPPVGLTRGQASHLITLLVEQGADRLAGAPDGPGPRKVTSREGGGPVE